MCELATAGFVLSALSAIGTAVGTIDSQIQSQARMENERKLSRWKEQAARNDAEATREQARVSAAEMRREAARRQGTLRAHAARSGGASGSILDLMGSQAREDELSAQKTLYAGESRARDILMGADAERFDRQSDSVPGLDPFDFVSPAISLLSATGTAKADGVFDISASGGAKIPAG